MKAALFYYLVIAKSVAPWQFHRQLGYDCPMELLMASYF
jgi:hypothetical protein